MRKEIQKNLIVQLKLHKESKDANGNVVAQSASQLMKLRYGIREWDLFLKSVIQMGWTRIDVVKCLDGNKRIEENGVVNHPEVDVPDCIAAEIKKAMVGEEKQLTPEQQEIKELKAQMAELLGSKKDKPKDPAKVIEPKVDEELNDAREEYLKVFGKKANHLMKAKGINKAIKEELSSVSSKAEKK